MPYIWGQCKNPGIVHYRGFSCRFRRHKIPGPDPGEAGVLPARVQPADPVMPRLCKFGSRIDEVKKT